MPAAGIVPQGPRDASPSRSLDLAWMAVPVLKDSLSRPNLWDYGSESRQNLG